jgi:signal transduction histidine kinase
VPGATWNMLVEGVEHAGVERERRSGASSVALEFKTPVSTSLCAIA